MADHTHSAFYDAYIKSQEWDDKREQALRHYGYKCRKCGSPFHLQVHHLNYHRLGHERISDLTILCDACHALAHAKLQRYRSKPKTIPIKPRQNQQPPKAAKAAKAAKAEEGPTSDIARTLRPKTKAKTKTKTKESK